jgi:pimeloyl-ACP methyl ester carboxylesterase
MRGGREGLPKLNGADVTRRRAGLLVAGLLLAGLGLALSRAFVPDVPVATLLPAYAGGASKFIEVQGLLVHYRDEGTGAPLVLLHGTGASLHTWNGWAAALSPQYRVVRMDLPGFGLTGPNRSADYSIPAYVAFLESFRETLGLSSFALAGNSLGGEIAWSYAVAHPDRVTALILVDSAGFPIERPALVFTLARIPLLSTLLAWADPGPMVKKTLREAYGEPGQVTPELVQRYRLLALRAGNRGAFVARAQAPRVDRSAQLSLLRVPTLVLWGRKDHLIPVAHASRFTEAIPGAELHLYDALGHVPMEESGQSTALDVEAFLSKALAARRSKPMEARTP